VATRLWRSTKAERAAQFEKHRLRATLLFLPPLPDPRRGEGATPWQSRGVGHPAQSCIADIMNRCLRHPRRSTRGERAAEFEKRKLCATPLLLVPPSRVADFPKLEKFDVTAVTALEGSRVDLRHSIIYT
jgi:hypothetical protein